MDDGCRIAHCNGESNGGSPLPAFILAFVAMALLTGAAWAQERTPEARIPEPERSLTVFSRQMRWSREAPETAAVPLFFSAPVTGIRLSWTEWGVKARM